MTIKDIMLSITPDNIKTIPLYNDMIEIFCNQLDQVSSFSYDINGIFTSNSTILKEQFLKTYLADVFNVFTQAQTNKTILDSASQVNQRFGTDLISTTYLQNLIKSLNYEHFATSRNYSQKKGTATAIEYIYNLVEMAQGNGDSSFQFYDKGIPFYFEVEGSIRREVYDQIVKLLSHPLGFAYLYTVVMRLLFDDLFNIKFVYNVQTLEVRCLSGSIDAYDGSLVVDIYSIVDELGYLTQKFTFQDGSYLKQTTNPEIHVAYYDIDNNIIKDYAGHCSIYSLYTTSIEVLTKDYLYFDVSSNLGTEQFMIHPDKACSIVGSSVIGNFLICGGRLTALENFNIDMTIDFRKNWNYLKRYTEPLIEGTTNVSPEVWEEVYGKVEFKQHASVNQFRIGSALIENQNSRKAVSGRLNNILEETNNPERISEQAGVGRFTIGGKSTSIIDYNHVWEHIRGSDGSLPLIGQGTIAAHFVIGGFDKLTVDYPVFEDRVVKKTPAYATDLWDIQEFTTEMFDIQDWHTFKDTVDFTDSELTIISDNLLIESAYELNTLAKLSDLNLVLGTFKVGGNSVRSVMDDLIIEVL